MQAEALPALALFAGSTPAEIAAQAADTDPDILVECPWLAECAVVEPTAEALACAEDEVIIVRCPDGSVAALFWDGFCEAERSAQCCAMTAEEAVAACFASRSDKA